MFIGAVPLDPASALMIIRGKATGRCRLRSWRAIPITDFLRD